MPNRRIGDNAGETEQTGQIVRPVCGLARRPEAGDWVERGAAGTSSWDLIGLRPPLPSPPKPRYRAARALARHPSTANLPTSPSSFVAADPLLASRSRETLGSLPGAALAHVTGMLADPGGVNQLTEQIIGAAIRVHREFGPGLLESTYAACLNMELRARKLRIESQVALPVVYHGLRLDVGYRIDMIVEDSVVVEIKAVESLAPIHRAQVLTYLKLRRCPVGLLLNFNYRCSRTDREDRECIIGTNRRTPG